jgi:hypothetical protein
MGNDKLIIKNWIGRTGNNLISLLNALFISVFNNYNLSFPKHQFLNTTSITFDNCNTNVKIHDENNTFYYKSKLKNINDIMFYDKSTQKKVYKIMKKMCLIKIPYKQNNDLVIHIRSGDQFDNRKCFSTSYYLAPPFYYYDTILSNNNFDNIYIIAEDNKNPVIQKLCKKYPNIKFEIQSLEKDIKILLSSSNVIFSAGTFLNLLVFSENIKTVYFPKYIKKDLNTGHKIFDTETGYMYHNDIYYIRLLNVNIKSIYIDLEDYPQKMYKSQNKIECLLNYEKNTRFIINEYFNYIE